MLTRVTLTSAHQLKTQSVLSKMARKKSYKTKGEIRTSFIFPSLNQNISQAVSDHIASARLYGNLMEYAADEDAETGYWGVFLGLVLESLARGADGM
jgi:hypothetical protein